MKHKLKILILAAMLATPFAQTANADQATTSAGVLIQDARMMNSGGQREMIINLVGSHTICMQPWVLRINASSPIFDDVSKMVKAAILADQKVRFYYADTCIAGGNHAEVTAMFLCRYDKCWDS